MMHLIRGILLLPPVMIALAACDELNENQSTVEQDPPGDIRTVIEIDTRYRDPADGSGDPGDPSDDILSTFTALSLSYGTGADAIPIVLADGDTLTATTAAGPVDLQAGQTSQGATVYTYTFEPAVTADALTISLERDTPPPAPWFPADDSPEPDFIDYYVEAPNSTIDLPPDVAIDLPDNEQGYIADDGAEITVIWSPSNVWTPDNVSKPDTTNNDIDDGVDTAHTLNFFARCDYTGDTNEGWIEVEGDPGAVTVEVLELFRNQFHPDKPLVLNPGRSRCDVELRIVRHATGAVDPALDDTSRINAVLRSRTVNIVTCPPSSSTCPPEDS